MIGLLLLLFLELLLIKKFNQIVKQLINGLTVITSKCNIDTIVT